MENFLNNGKVESFLLAENAAHLLESYGEKVKSESVDLEVKVLYDPNMLV